jgi:hypothetical protein
MKRNRLIALFLIALFFVDVKEAKALTKFDQDYSTFQKLLENNNSPASLVAVYDQLYPAIKVLNDGAYRCRIIFSINGEMKEPIRDLYVKSLIHFYPGQGKNAFGPYKREKAFAPTKVGSFTIANYMGDKVSINICLKDCSQSDLTKKENIYYPLIMTILSAGDAMAWYGDSNVLKEFFEKSFGESIVENWSEVEIGNKTLIITKEMISNMPDGGKSILEKIIETHKKRTDELR